MVKSASVYTLHPRIHLSACRACNGSGRVRRPRCYTSIGAATIRCADCGGSGTRVDANAVPWPRPAA